MPEPDGRAHVVCRPLSARMSIVANVAEAPGEDADLVARLCAGEEAAFARLVDAWSAGMVRLARTIVSTEASAAEVVQETWLAVVASVSGFEGRSSLRTWVY